MIKHKENKITPTDRLYYGENSEDYLRILRFGTKRDYDDMILEIKWLKSIKSKLSTEDITYLSAKYLFPPSFVEAVAQGHLDISDWSISKSKWYPIIMFWMTDYYSKHNIANNTMYKYIREINRIYQMLIFAFLIILPMVYSLITMTFAISLLDIYHILSENIIILPSLAGILGLIFNGIKSIHTKLNEKPIKTRDILRKVLLPSEAELYILYDETINLISKINSLHLRTTISGIISMIIVVSILDYYTGLRLLELLLAIPLWMILSLIISLILNRNNKITILKKRIRAIPENQYTKTLKEELLKSLNFAFPQYYLEGLFKSLAQRTIFANMLELGKVRNIPIYLIEPLSHVIQIYRERIKKLEEKPNDSPMPSNKDNDSKQK